MGEFLWHGWVDGNYYRRRWEENGLLGQDLGMLMVLDGEERVGTVGWYRRLLPPFAHCWNFGGWMLPHARRRGYGVQATRLGVEYLFAHTQMQRIEAHVEVDNLAAQRVVEAAGFLREGVMRGAAWRDGAWRDCVFYGMLRTDPRSPTKPPTRAG